MRRVRFPSVIDQSKTLRELEDERRQRARQERERLGAFDMLRNWSDYEEVSTMFD